MSLEALDMAVINEDDVDPIHDIIDYLVRSANISFKNAHVNEEEIRTRDKIRMATELFKKSPTDFLLEFGKYLAPYHMNYFENLESTSEAYKECIRKLKVYHSDASKHKRIRNRRYNALQKLQNDTDYFSERQMMSRNPLLYEQLIGQYMTDEEIKERDEIDSENLNLLTMILDTVDRNEITQKKNEQLLEEGMENVEINTTDINTEKGKYEVKKMWGDFDTPDTRPSHVPEQRKQNTISAPERRLLRQEFYQEMYSSFIEGRDDFDYNAVDNNEQYDDLQQLSQDAEDKYFDSETNDVDNLEEHMKLVDEYGRKLSNTPLDQDDPLDVFMTHISNKLKHP